jgi:hypothetical protein
VSERVNGRRQEEKKKKRELGRGRGVCGSARDERNKQGGKKKKKRGEANEFTFLKNFN